MLIHGVIAPENTQYHARISEVEYPTAIGKE
jgi:hypothetical protein